MLGIGKQKFSMEVSAYGKHPAFDDYFRVNMDTPLTSALSAWIENGVKSGGTADKSKKIRSFRFWVLGMKKEELVLGIIRDSSDRLGRTYPLLIICKTRMKNRGKQWPVIFTGFEPVFRSFEEMTTLRYEAFIEFEANLLKIQSFEPNFEKMDETAFSNSLMTWFKMEGKGRSLSIPVSVLLDKFGSHPHGLEKEGRAQINCLPPGAIFLGGLPDTPVVNIYNRPLKTQDFTRLFNLPHGHQNEMDFHTQ